MMMQFNAYFQNIMTILFLKLQDCQTNYTTVFNQHNFFQWDIAQNILHGQQMGTKKYEVQLKTQRSYVRK